MTRKQFRDVPCTHGAPMGRRGYGDPEDKPCLLFKVVMVDGDYDDGGAYWGGGGEPLYCLRGEECEHFVRAKTRTHAFLKLRQDFPNLRLAKPVHPRIIESFEKEIATGLRKPDGTSLIGFPT